MNVKTTYQHWIDHATDDEVLAATAEFREARHDARRFGDLHEDPKFRAFVAARVRARGGFPVGDTPGNQDDDQDEDQDEEDEEDQDEDDEEDQDEEDEEDQDEDDQDEEDDDDGDEW